MARPTALPSFATAPTYPAGGSPWSSQPPRVAPSGGMIAQGFTPQADLPAEYMNYLLGNHGDWIGYLDSSQGIGLLGDGSDGVVTFDGTTTVLGLVPSSGKYTMTRDIFLGSGTSLVTGASTVLNPNGFRIFSRGIFQTASGGTVVASGAAASGGVPGAGIGYGSIGGGTSGGQGNSIAVGSPGVTAILAAGGAGGAGGNGAVNNGGVGGVITNAISSSNPSLRTFSPSAFGLLIGPAVGSSFAPGTAAGAVLAFSGGTGGGGGGTNNTAFGGGGGGGGGVVAIAAQSIILANGTDLQAKGGAGGAGNTNGGGGGGGGGGVILLAYGTLTISSGSITAAVNCAGGAAGPLNGSAAAGVAGSNGAFFQVALTNTSGSTTGTASPTNYQEGVAVFATGGSGQGFDYSDVVFPSPFATAATGASGYKVQISASAYSGTTAPAYAIINRTLIGFRIQLVSQFSGQFDWTVTQ